MAHPKPDVIPAHSTTEKVAVKVIDKLQLDDRARRLLSNEVSCMEQLDHPNVLSLFEVIDTFHKMYIVTEYASGGDLQGRVNNQGPMREDEGRLLFAQLVSAVDHMVRAPPTPPLCSVYV